MNNRPKIIYRYHFQGPLPVSGERRPPHTVDVEEGVSFRGDNVLVQGRVQIVSVRVKATGPDIDHFYIVQVWLGSKVLLILDGQSAFPKGATERVWGITPAREAVFPADSAKQPEVYVRPMGHGPDSAFAVGALDVELVVWPVAGTQQVLSSGWDDDPFDLAEQE